MSKTEYEKLCKWLCSLKVDVGHVKSPNMLIFWWRYDDYSISTSILSMGQVNITFHMRDSRIIISRSIIDKIVVSFL